MKSSRILLDRQRVERRCDTPKVIAWAKGRRSQCGGPDAMSTSSLSWRGRGHPPGLFRAWKAGETCGVFTAERFTADVTASPVPHFDLIDCTSACNSLAAV